MKLKGKLIMGLLGGAMLALPMTAPAFAQSSYSTDSNYIQKVDWWWDHYRATATVTPITVGIKDFTNIAATGMPATARAVSRPKCGEIGTRGILPRLET